jgi:Ca-activated chloride channel family protein
MNRKKRRWHEGDGIRTTCISLSADISTADDPIYVLKQHKVTASVRVPVMQQFENSVTTFRHWLRHILFGFRTAAVGLLIIVLARPQTTNNFQDISTEGIDIVLTLDISGSMLARDFNPDRLEASKNVATEFITGRPYDRIGLVVFSGESFTQCPLTTDHAVLINLLREMKSGMIEDGTAIGEGLATAVNRIKDSESKSKVIILLTDGVNNRGIIAPLTAAEIAKTYGIRVYTIGVGTQGVAPYPVQTPFGIQYQDMPVEIDEAILKQISQMTDGRYFRATDNEKLVQVYSEIDKMEKSRIDVRQFKIRDEKYLFPALIAFCLILLELIVRNTLLKSLT